MGSGSPKWKFQLKSDMDLLASMLVCLGLAVVMVGLVRWRKRGLRIAAAGVAVVAVGFLLRITPDNAFHRNTHWKLRNVRKRRGKVKNCSTEIDIMISQGPGLQI